MILYQVAWEDQNDMVLEFVKQSEEDHKLFDPDNIKRLNLKYEISKRNDFAGTRNAYPILVSVKKFHIIQKAIAFSINLDKIINPDELQIYFSKLTVIFHSGKRKEILINKHYRMSDIDIEKDFYTEFYSANEEELEDFLTNSITHEEIYKEVQTDGENNKKKKRVIYKRNQAKIDHANSEVVELLRENNQRLENVEKALNNLTKTLQNLDELNLKTNSVGNSSALPPPPPASKTLKKPKNASSLNKKSKSFPQRKTATLTPKNSKMAFLSELKEILNSSKQKSGEFNVKDVLKPMSDDELDEITLKDEDLKKRKLDFISRKIAKQEQSE
ncbi:MAG: hypothetical protein ACOC35_00585 [Promethearchaeia archaeon]